jgi:hypothetical protein
MKLIFQFPTLVLLSLVFGARVITVIAFCHNLRVSLSVSLRSDGRAAAFVSDAQFF